MTILDWLSVVPFYIEVISGTLLDSGARESNAAKYIRIFKIFRLFKLLRHFRGFDIFLRAFYQSLGKLYIPFFILILMSFLFGFMLYLAEKPPDAEYCATVEQCSFPNAVYGIWVVMISFTSVGYGEIFPETSLGKVVAVFVMVIGAFWMALPLTLLGAKFYTCYKQEKKHEKTSDELIETSEKTGNSVPRLVNMRWEWVKDFNNLPVYMDEILQRIASSRSGVASSSHLKFAPGTSLSPGADLELSHGLNANKTGARITKAVPELFNPLLKPSSNRSNENCDERTNSNLGQNDTAEERPEVLSSHQEDMYVAYQAAVLCNGQNSLFAKHFTMLRSYCEATSD